MGKMTEKQRMFADKYIETGNAEESAKFAGYSARGNTTKLLQNTTISNYIAEVMEQKDVERIASQDEILQRLTKVLRREEMEHTVITVKSRRTYTDENGKKQTVEEERGEVVPVPTKVADMNRAAELLGRRYAMWTDNKNVEVSGAVQFVDDVGEEDAD